MKMRFARVLSGICTSLLLMAATAGVHARDLVVALKTEPSSLDPQYHSLTPNIQISLTMFDPLVRSDPDLRPIPSLAESWENDGNAWIFHLRRGVKFSDGTPLTAHDVVFTYDRVPKVPNSPSSFTLYLGPGAKTEALDDYTVRITTSTPFPILPISLSNLAIMSSKAASGPAPEGKTTTELNSGNGLVGTGPYRFVSWRRGAELVLERNPHYWGTPPDWDRIVYRPISNPAARVAALLAGDVDMVEDPPTDDLARLKQNKQLYVEEKPSVRVMYLALDQYAEPSPGIRGTDKNPLKDRRVREALSLAIDRYAIADRVMGGAAIPAGNLLPYPMFGTSEKYAEAPRANVERARQLLAEAGYPNGFEITLGAPSGRYINDARIAQTVASMWTRIGVKTDVDAKAPPVFFKNRDAYAFSAYLAGWSSTGGEMSNPMRALLVTPNPAEGLGTTNRSRYSNPDMDALVVQASATMDDARRADLLRQASEIAMADYAMLPLHFEMSAWAMKDEIRYVGHAGQLVLVQNASLKK